MTFYDAPNQEVVRGAPPETAPERERERAGSFDPADATVDEVKDYVEAHPDETEQVLQAERAGKGRSTLVVWLEGQLG